MDCSVCYIKPEYLIADKKVGDSFVANGKDETSEGNQRNVSGDTGNTHVDTRKRGKNRKRPIYKEERQVNLCNTLLNGPTNTKCDYSDCKYLHDVDLYLKLKPDDIGDKCYVYSVRGFCPRGITCRFANSHLDESYNNMRSDSYDEHKQNSTFNGINSELQVKLRKREYDFSLSINAVRRFEKLRNEKNIASKDSKASNEAAVGCVLDTDVIRETRSEKPQIDFRNKLILSPLTTVGNLPFRRICKEFGADITCGEMACAVPLLKGLNQEWALTKRHECENVFGVQVCGSNPQLICQSVQLLKENCNIDFVDLNIGCPIDLIFQQGGGSALIRKQNTLEVIVRSCSTMLEDLPFTVKTRTGIYADKNVAHDLLPKMEQWGASAITLHGRSKEQRYTKSANWEYIEECASKVNTIPIIGNGDILSFEDYTEKKANAPHVSSFMIGRGALIKPWIFKEIKDQKEWDPSSKERFEILQKYVNYGLEHWGSDTKGVENTRRFLLEWISFLYRYIPVGLLQYPPQRINQRPQKYYGRDELETLMSSNNCSDWIKISEMLLGPVPSGFAFLPKHKANSY